MLLLTAGVGEAAVSNLGEATLCALLGYGVVFAGLIVLILVIKFMSFCVMKAQHEAPIVPAEDVVPAPAAAPAAVTVSEAPGTAGQIKLYDVPPKTAAMLMAIVADTMGKPLNELRFISIKEVK